MWSATGGQSLWSFASQASLMRLSTSSSADRIIGSREVSLSKGRSKTSEICQQNSKDSARTDGPVLSSQRPQFGSQKTEHYTNTICKPNWVCDWFNCDALLTVDIVSYTRLIQPERNREETRHTHTHTHTQTRKQQEVQHESDVKDNRIRTACFWVITQRVVVIYYRRFGTT